MSSSSSMADIAGLAGASSEYVVKNSTSRKGNTELNMEDFLQLMIVQLQSQTIDDTMDTGEMMNQMVQMQMITAITNMTETSITSYASSLVGKVVTIGIAGEDGVEERVLRVMGTGVLNGQQVIFCSDGEAYALNQIMAVGYLPNEDGSYGNVENPGENKDPVEDTENPGDATEKPDGGSGDGTGDGAGDVTGGGEGSVEGGNAAETASYQGDQGAPTD